MKNLNELTDAIIGAAMEVHRMLGPGLLESTYEMVEYKGVKLDCGYRADIVVDETILIEIKAVDSVLAIHDAQLLSYLKLGGWKIGLLINFNVELLKHGLRRRVLGLSEEATL